MLMSEDARGMTPGDLAMRCDDALELEKLLTVVVFDTYQMVRPSEHM